MSAEALIDAVFFSNASTPLENAALSWALPIGAPNVGRVPSLLARPYLASITRRSPVRTMISLLPFSGPTVKAIGRELSSKVSVAAQPRERSALM
ncbi:hypothetical protein D3C87_1508760 [compost metagenome]